MAGTRKTDPNDLVLIQAQVPLHVRNTIKGAALLEKMQYQELISKVLVQYVKARFPDRFEEEESIEVNPLIESLVD